MQCFLQVATGIFTLFYHYALGKNSQKKAHHLATIFFLSVFLVNLAISSLVFYLVHDSEILRWVLCGIFAALSIISWLFYYRRGSGTRLYIPRVLARTINKSAKNAKSYTDAFLLGAFAGISELIYTVPIFIILALKAKSFDNFYIEIGIFVINLLILMVPFYVIRLIYKSDGNLADIERMRVRNKGFFRAMLAIFCLVLAAAMFNFGIFK